MNTGNDALTNDNGKGAIQAPKTQRTYLVDLTHQGLLGVEGPDAAKFLQGQVTCDVRELANHNSLLGAQCTLKGRMLLNFRALQLHHELIFLRMHHGLLATAIASFGKYIVFSKARLFDRSEDYRRIGMHGVEAKTIITKVLGCSPAEQNNAWCNAAGHIIITLSSERYELWLRLDEQAENIRAALAAECMSADQNQWTLADIRAGLGEVRLETCEVFTPQAINYQLVNGINFRKGCYTGQEIVARLHYRGTLKRHMYRLAYSSRSDAPLPLPGSNVVNAQQEVIGEIVMAAMSSPHAIEVLATLRDDQREQAYIPSSSPKKLELMTLPYAIPSEEKAD